ncbi:uncharacterized protein N7483_006518 [Penicillium malachiteum]|uniref:uncharacterized protein n=1 Tax=Penicillium malachiteum TaxID=1324776 RepID=UPI002546D3E4|nr:uncharacterized protein N7483_006518 [Penicillium malachiteum]KAJ5725161.1 hypothetical protein N7483_006518 [Penicillium malachiteum]
MFLMDLHHTPRWVVAQQSEESYQEQVEKWVQEMKERDWGDIEDRYLEIMERAVPDCQYVMTLTDVQIWQTVHQVPHWQFVNMTATHQVGEYRCFL